MFFSLLALTDFLQDDGGHANHQILNSFATLFHQGLKPGGIYFVEDLQDSRYALYRGPAGTPVMARVITDWIESILATHSFATLTNLKDRPSVQASYAFYKASQQAILDGGSAYLPVWKLPTGVKMVDCAAQMCAFVKCTLDDRLCPDGMAQQPVEA